MDIHPLIPVVVAFVAFLLAFTVHVGWFAVSVVAILVWAINFLRWAFS